MRRGKNQADRKIGFRSAWFFIRQGNQVARTLLKGAASGTRRFWRPLRCRRVSQGAEVPEVPEVPKASKGPEVSRGQGAHFRGGRGRLSKKASLKCD